MQYILKLNNLIKQEIVTVPFSSFKIINGGKILERCFVEAFGYEHNIKGTIVSVIPFQSLGYNENAVLLKDNFLICSCFISEEYFNSEFYMEILVTYI